MKQWILGWVIALIIVFGFFSLVGAEFNEIEKKWQQENVENDRIWKTKKASLDEKWNQFERAQAAKWALFEQRVKQKWDVFIRSTNKDWVEYSASFDTRSWVDFENGRVRLEVVVSATDPGAQNRAPEKLKDQIETLFDVEDETGKKILDSQVANKMNRKIDEKTVGDYFERELKPIIKASPKPFKSLDGEVRRKYALDFDLVPDHIRVRAERYLPTVSANAQRFKLKPQLIMAVIHSESYFNPRAASSAGAFGLMQIIPRYAGRDAYQFIYGDDRLITDQYLFDSTKNIEMGCAYLHILKYIHFQDVGGEIKNRYVAICGYNWGPTNIRKKVINKYDINNMSEANVYHLLRSITPGETSEYIKRVMDRMPIYDPFFSRGHG